MCLQYPKRKLEETNLEHGELVKNMWFDVSWSHKRCKDDNQCCHINYKGMTSLIVSFFTSPVLLPLLASCPPSPPLVFCLSATLGFSLFILIVVHHVLLQFNMRVSACLPHSWQPRHEPCWRYVRPPSSSVGSSTFKHGEFLFVHVFGSQAHLRCVINTTFMSLPIKRFTALLRNKG